MITSRRRRFLLRMLACAAACGWPRAPRAGEYIKAVAGPVPRMSDGRIDPERTIAALRKIHANALILHLGYAKQWEDVQRFLPRADKAGVKLFLILPDARHGVGPCGCGKEWWWWQPVPYCKDYVKWMDALAKLSLRHPALQGVFIDDFESGAFSPHAGFTVDYIRQLMETKNRINPKFKFLPGIYLPRGMCEFQVKQKGGSSKHMKRIAFEADYACAKTPKRASVRLIAQAHPSDYFVQRLSVNGEVVFADTLSGRRLVMSEHNLKVYDPRRWRIRYEILHTGFVNYLDCLFTPSVFVDGEEAKLNWRVRSDDDHFTWTRYAGGKLKPYYELTDGVVFWGNAFDLVRPETELYKELVRTARKRLGPGKLIFGHFYGAEPWREPVFPSEHYFDSYARAAARLCDGLAPWFACLLPYYTGYASGIYSPPKNDKPGYDARFRFPGLTTYELGFFQGVEADFAAPSRVETLEIDFTIEDDKPGPYVGRWVKELVFKSGRFQHELIPRKQFAKSDKLWFKEVGAVWSDFVRGNEGRQHVRLRLSGDQARRVLPPGRKAALVLRLRADAFRGAGSAPPEVNVYVTYPKVVVNGQPLNLQWRFVAGNALERLWLRSSRKLAQIFAGN